ncbi:MAG: pyridoxamine 5'-phosphate oxidase family protein [Erythrobacter sp.]
MFETLDDVLADMAQRLEGAATNRKCPMHMPVVVTSNVDARTMVLRAFDGQDWSVRFHTDMRSPKVAAIAADPRMAVLLYDHPGKVQIRVRGRGEIISTGDIAERAWVSSDNFARRCYLGDSPGAISDRATSGLPAEFEGIKPSDDDLVPARQNFAALQITLTSLDWQYLAQSGHMRAQFDRDGDIWSGRWVAP